MKTLLDWMKGNLLTVVSIVVVIISFGVIGVYWAKGSALRSEAQQRFNDESGKINSVMRRSVDIPPESPDGEPERITGVTVTEGAISELERLHGQISKQYETVFAAAERFNRGEHERLVPTLFTDRATSSVPFDARDAYREAFPRMLGPANEPGQVRLNADLPPSADTIQAELQRLDQQIRAEFGPRERGERGDDQLSQRQEAELREQMAGRARDMLRETATRIGVYAQTDPASNDFPFQIGDWARSGEQPAQYQLWEGQLELWIQRDIARAIARANGIDEGQRDVMQAPVKRLLSVEVLPGYVGLHTLGGLATGPSASSIDRRAGGAYPPPAGGLRTNDIARGGLPVNFHAGPTGRVSNALYDVRHARLVAVVDDAQLPRLFRALGEVNFMTVLRSNITDVDEYEALREGFVYGSGNAVEVDMILETIWLRSWTEPMMPERVRQYVGIDAPPVEEGRFR